MPRKKSLTPKLFKRGANGNWCFRRFVNGKDKVINTGTPVATEAKRIMRQYVSLEIEAENRNARGELATKTAQLIMQTVRGEGIERFTFEEAFQIYLDVTEIFPVWIPTGLNGIPIQRNISPAWESLPMPVSPSWRVLPNRNASAYRSEPKRDWHVFSLREENWAGRRPTIP